MNNNKYQKRGILISPDKSKWWWKSHAMTPTPLKVNEETYKIFFCGRDDFNRSQIGYALIKIKNESIALIEISAEPIFKNGRLGTFDDNGVTPSCALKIKKEIFLYYIGWNPGSTTRMNIFGGLAISKDNGSSFKRFSEAPIIERNRVNPLINTSPFVISITDNLYYMYYVAGVEWVHKDLPKYNIQLAISKNGIDWNRNGHICIDFRNKEEVALARPFVIKNKDFFEMWFCHKSINTNYEFGYATSSDGINWIRKENLPSILPSSEKGSWDSEMNAYPCIIRNKNYEFLIYNGNGYGLNGIGYAVRKI